MNACQLSTWDGQVSGLLRARAEQHRIKVFLKLLCTDALLGPIGHLGVLGPCANGDRGFKDHALGLHLFNTAINVGLLHLEVWDTVAKQAAHTVIFFKHRHRMTHTRELLCCRQASRTGADHGHFFPRFERGHQGLDPALRPSFIDDGVLDRFDPHRIVVDVQGASGLARCGADATGELRKVVGRMQNLDGVVPVALEHQLIEVGNDVVDGAAVVAKGRSTIHAARTLVLGTCVVQGEDEFFVIFDPLGHRFVTLFEAFNF